MATFILGKLVAFGLRPFNWLLLLLLLAWFHRRRRQRWLAAAIVVALVFSNGLLFHWAISRWEYPPQALRQNYDAAIVLGGILAESGRLAPAPPELSDRADRLLAAAQLWRQGKVKRLLISGGSGDLLHQRPPEAEIAARYLRQLGIPDSVILTECQSINTDQNARFSAALLRQHWPQGARCVLVTSAWHMPRALRCFEKAGLAPRPYPVDYLQPRMAPHWLQSLTPSATYWGHWELLMKEWVGYVVYSMSPA